MSYRNIYCSLVIYAGLLSGISAQTDISFVDPSTPQETSPLLVLDSTYVLEFSDEFNDTEVNTEKWRVVTSPRSRSPRRKLSIDDWWWVEENVEERDGNLVLKVSKPGSNTMYCGAISTNNKYEKRFGYYETRIQIAEAAKGTHTAFWLMGDHMGHVDSTGNDGAEIDVFESAWLEDFTKSVVHIDGYGADHKANTRRYDTPGIHHGFHTYGLHWTEDFLKIYYDGQLKVTYQGIWVPQVNEYILLSDGASFGFEGDHFTRQPLGHLTEAYVDYIRVWRQEDKKPVEASYAIEAECVFEKEESWYFGEDEIDASNGFFLEPDPNLTEAATKVPIGSGTASYNFEITEGQVYHLWARMNVADTAANSIFLSTNGFNYKELRPEFESEGEWEWVYLREYYFSSGSQDLFLAYKD